MKDYSRQHWTDYQYRDWMREYPAKSVYNSILENNPGHGQFTGDRAKNSLQASVTKYMKQSELKKPYNGKGFPQMEHDWEGPPGGFKNGPYPKFDHPWTVGVPKAPVVTVFDVESSGCYCDQETRNFSITGTHPIYSVTMTNEYAGTTFSILGGLGTNEVFCTITAADGQAPGSINFTGFMVTFTGISGNSNYLMGECRDCDECDTTPVLSLGSNPETMAHNASVTINVADGVGPYSWVVTTTGHGFTVSDASTAGTSNTLITDLPACGTGIVTVTDSCGNSVVIEVRCTRGEWVFKNNTCEIPGVEQTTQTRIVGRYKQVQAWSEAACLCNPPGSQYNCPPDCNSSGDGTCAISCGSQGSGTVCVQVAGCGSVNPAISSWTLIDLCCESGSDACVALDVATPVLYQWDCPTGP